MITEMPGEEVLLSLPLVIVYLLLSISAASPWKASLTIPRTRQLLSQFCTPLLTLCLSSTSFHLCLLLVLFCAQLCHAVSALQQVIHVSYAPVLVCCCWSSNRRPQGAGRAACPVRSQEGLLMASLCFWWLLLNLAFLGHALPLVSLITLCLCLF